MNILQVCAYAAEYDGNFVKSLYALESKLVNQGHKVIYAFPEKAKDKEWCKLLCKRAVVHFLPLEKARILPRTYSTLRKIMKRHSIDIVHSHFELYDIPCNLTKLKKTKVFWHLHDPISLNNKLSRNILTKLQYSFFSKNVELLSVSEHYRETAVKLGFNEKNTYCVLNGIDLSRIGYPYKNKSRKYDFITFGWDFYRKGSDIIFQALQKLCDEGFCFKFLFNCNDRTTENLTAYFNGKFPDWLDIGKPVSDINTLFSDTDVFIQASRRETFSYAVCEAAYAGLYVISSDIPGLEWAHSLTTVSFFENEDVDGLYMLLKKVLTDRALLDENCIAQSRKEIETHFSTDVWTDNIISYYFESER